MVKPFEKERATGSGEITEEMAKEELEIDLGTSKPEAEGIIRKKASSGGTPGRDE